MLSLQSVILLAALWGTPAPAGQAPVLEIGFVDVERVIQEYKKTREITRELDKRISEEKRLLAARKEALRHKMDALDALELEADDLDAMVKGIQLKKEIALETVDIELSEKHALIQLEQGLVLHIKKVYSEICREAEAMARERGLKAVFMVANSKIEGRTRSQVNSEILVRPVLWFDPSLDLSSAMILRLNK